MFQKLVPAFLLTFVNVLGFSILMPILPFVVKDYGAPEWFYGLLLTFYSAFQFFGAPFLGALSDHMGRKPVLLVSQAGTLLSWFVFVFALYLPKDQQLFGFSIALWVIAFSRILDGITGGNASVTNAYVADITTSKEKASVFGYLGGIAGIGLIVGPGLGGLTASSSWGYLGTMVTAIAISTVTLIAIFFWLKESHPEEKRSPAGKQRIVKNLFLIKRIRELNISPFLKRIFLLKLLFSTTVACYIGSIALYLIDLFDFNKQELGFFMLVVGLFLSFNQAVVSRMFVRWFGEYNTLKIGLSGVFIGLFCITLTSNLWVFISFYYIMNLGLSLSFPTFNSVIAQHANPQKQGETMGVSDSIHSFAMASFPLVSAALYGWIGSYAYWIYAAFPLVAVFIAFGTKSEAAPTEN
ncbi:MAG: MFS transporter [Crocinitomicaceae bacterium]|nr:MFS transporter [Crocinitomicaceae bacterium]